MVRHLPAAGWAGHGWEPTHATHQLQLLVGAYLLLAGLFELVLATLSNGYVRRSTLAAIGPHAAGLSPAAVQRIVDASVGIGVAAAILMALVYVVLGVLTVATRPPWLFYADLLVLGLVALGLPLGVAGLVRGDAGPPAFLAPTLLLAVLSLALFAWMLVERLRTGGPWACRKTFD